MPDKSKKTEVTILMLHKVELRLEILWRGNIRLQAASLNENVLLDRLILMTILMIFFKVSGESVRIRAY